MIRLWFILALLATGPATAQTVRITSGEHDGFTRLVFDFGRVVDWQVGRSTDGYELRLPDKNTRYDLSQAFALIGKSRLAALWVSPQSGQLHIGLACACHALPFEFRPGIVVVDLKDGPPPAGSAFELALDGSTFPALAAPPIVRPRPRPEAQLPQPKTNEGTTTYDWIATTRSRQIDTVIAPEQKVKMAAGPTVLPPDPGLQPLRDTLIQQMARGASQGVVNMEKPSSDMGNLANATFPSAQIRVGDAPASVNRPLNSVQGDLGAQGAVCLAAEAVDLPAWGDETLPLADQIASTHANLTGEFDAPQTIEILTAIRLQLFLGFGVEAKQTAQAFEVKDEGIAVLMAMADVLDGTPPSSDALKGQAACAGPVALWAFLADSGLGAGDPINKPAVQLAFSALPLHLRRQFGPVLAERFLAIGDSEAVRAVRDAITRAPGEKGSSVGLIEAEMAMQAGDAAAAEALANQLISDAGPDQVEALIALTKARIAQNLPVEPEVALALQAHLAENTGSVLETPLQEAVMLAQAASGNFEAAFDALANHANRQDEVWSLLAGLAEDGVFLTFAVLGPEQSYPNIGTETKAQIARRLTGLGLPAPARGWLINLDNADPLLRAETALKARDGKATLAALTTTDGDLADAMQLQALELLGQDELRAELLAKSGDVLAAQAAQARSGNWQSLRAMGDSPWAGLADHLPPTPEPATTDQGLPYGPLARGHDLIAAGGETRAAIEALLSALPIPPAAVNSPDPSKSDQVIPTN